MTPGRDPAESKTLQTADPADSPAAPEADAPLAESTNARLLKRLGLYFLGNVSAKLVAMLLTRLQTYFLSTVSFGSVTIVLNTVPLLVSFSFMEIWAAILKFMYEEDEESRKRRVITNGFVIGLLMLPLFVLLTILLGHVAGPQYIPYIALYGVLFMLDNIYQFGARGLGFNRLFALTGIVSTAVLGIVQILCLAVFGLEDLALLISPAAASLVAVLIYEAKTRQLRSLRRRDVDPGLVRAMMRFALPLSMNAIAFFALTVMNQFILRHLRGPGDVGLYNAAGRISGLVNLLVTVFSLAWQETAFSLHRNAQRGAYYSETLARYVRVIAMALVVGIPFAGVAFPWLIDGSFAASQALLPAALLFAAMSALSSFMGHILSSERLTRQLTLSTLTAALVNVVSLLLLLPLIGLQAGYVALALGFTANFLYRFLAVRRTVTIRFPLKALPLYLILIAAVTVGFFRVDSRRGYWILLLVAAVPALIIMRSMVAGLWRLLGNMRAGRGSRAADAPPHTDDREAPSGPDERDAG